MSDDTERREFLKIAGAALGGLTLTALGATEAQADSTMMSPTIAPAMGAAHGRALRTLTLRCGPNIDVDHLVAALKKGLGQAGCMRCGLLGIDVVLHQGDPVEKPVGIPVKIDVPGVNQAIFG